MVRYPWAIVPPKGPSFAFSGSTWIHWWSPVASATVFTRSWVISRQSEVARCWPTSALSSWTPLIVRAMAARWRPLRATSVGGNLAGLFEATAAATPGTEAVVVDGERWTYASLDERTNRLA